MTLRCELYWSFRSPYSYLGARHYRRLTEEFDLEIDLRPVYPIAIRSPEFFEKVNPLWIPYLVKDCLRVAEHRGLPFQLPDPDPVVMNIQTREISADQPYIFRISRLGVEAKRRGRGLPFIDEVSDAIWGSHVVNWHEPENLAPIVARAGLDLADMEAVIEGKGDEFDAEIQANQDALEAAGHWGVPTLVFEGEPFFGQDRIDMAVWRMEQRGLEPRGRR